MTRRIEGWDLAQDIFQNATSPRVATTANNDARERWRRIVREAREKAEIDNSTPGRFRLQGRYYDEDGQFVRITDCVVEAESLARAITMLRCEVEDDGGREFVCTEGNRIQD